MSYVTGNAATMADIVAAVKSACTSNGWTLAGSVIHKGDCHVLLDVYSSSASAGGGPAGNRDYVRMQVGNGIDGGNNLTDTPTSTGVYIGPMITDAAAWVDWTFPVTYHIHINASPDEVYVVINYNSVYFQWLGFGQSTAQGNPGTGVWEHAFHSQRVTSTNYTYRRIGFMGCGPAGVDIGTGSNRTVCPQPFFSAGTSSAGYMNNFFHGMDGATGLASWTADLGYFENASVGNMKYAYGATALRPLLARQPNVWNNAAALFPLHLLTLRPSDKTSIVGEIAHMRTMRMDFLDAGDIIDLTPDKWKVYPCYRKDTVAPAGSADPKDGAGTLRTNDNSGCFAIALRYDGP